MAQRQGSRRSAETPEMRRIAFEILGPWLTSEAYTTWSRRMDDKAEVLEQDFVEAALAVDRMGSWRNHALDIKPVAHALADGWVSRHKVALTACVKHMQQTMVAQDLASS